MNNKISNDRRIYISAYDDYKYKKYESAINKLNQIYNGDSHLNYNHLMVKSLYKLKKYSLAEKYLLEFPDSYTNSVTSFKFMILVLLMNHSFIKAREIVSVIKNDTFKQQQLNQIKNYENHYLTINEDNINQKIEEFCGLVGKKISIQKKVLDKGLKLPLDKFLFACKYLLINPFLNPIMRISLFDILRKINLDSEIEFLWIDGNKYKINPYNLKPLSNTDSYVKLFKLTDYCYGNNDPIMTFRLNHIFNMQLLILYPYNDSVINDNLKEWFKISLSLINNKKIRHNKIYNLQIKLKQIINKLSI